jgi:hypothetical protein
MDTKALLQDESQNEMYYDEVSTSEDGLPKKGMKKIISRSSKIKRFLTPVLLYGCITFVYSLILVAVVLKMQALRLQGPGLIYCKFFLKSILDMLLIVMQHPPEKQCNMKRMFSIWIRVSKAHTLGSQVMH